MARTLEVIKEEIKTTIRTFSELDDFLFPEDVGGSQVSVFNVNIHSVAAAIYTLEVMVDLLKAEIQELADGAISGNAKWVQQQILKFQYGDTITLVDFVPTYDPVDESARIITRCSVVEASNGVLSIKVAKGDPTLEPLDAAELSALSDYYYGTSTTEGIGFAGVLANFVSLEPDRMRVEADIYFLGQYTEATVKAAVIDAIDDFFATFMDEAFDGTVYINKLRDVIEAVEGVSRVVITEIKARPEVTPLGSAVTVDIQGKYTTAAGYLIAEDETGNTLDDTITMIEESA